MITKGDDFWETGVLFVTTVSSVAFVDGVIFVDFSFEVSDVLLLLEFLGIRITRACCCFGWMLL